MVDNFMSAGTNGGEGDEEMPSPYGTGPNHRTTQGQDDTDYRPAGPEYGGYGDPGSQPTAGPAGPDQAPPRPIWYQPDADQPPVTPGYPVQPPLRNDPAPQVQQAPPPPAQDQANSWSRPQPETENIWQSRAPQPPPQQQPPQQDQRAPADPAAVDQPAAVDEPTGVDAPTAVDHSATAEPVTSDASAAPRAEDQPDTADLSAAAANLSSPAGTTERAAQPTGPVAEHDQAPAAADPVDQAATAVPTPSPTAAAAHQPEHAAPRPSTTPLSGSEAPAPKKPKRIRIHHLREMKERGEKWAMLTAYDQYAAEIFDQAGIQVLLVGDSAANNVYGYESTLRISVDELLALARGVVKAVRHTLVVADLPFGSYQGSAEQAFHTAVRFMKEAGVHAVKLEGGRTVVPQVQKIVQAGIPVMGHVGFTPQSEHGLGGYRVQGRGDSAAGLIEDAVALAEAGAFAVVLEMVPGDVAAEITKRIPVPTIGIGAGRDCDAQVLVWQDMAGLRSGQMPRFVKRYADLRSVLSDAATAYAADVASGAFPADEHTF
jgi:3-methyl-2-oxobutanoate hydroxymethyltransferase